MAGWRLDKSDFLSELAPSSVLESKAAKWKTTWVCDRFECLVTKKSPMFILARCKSNAPKTEIEIKFELEIGTTFEGLLFPLGVDSEKT